MRMRRSDFSCIENGAHVVTFLEFRTWLLHIYTLIRLLCMDDVVEYNTPSYCLFSDKKMANSCGL